MYIAYNFSISSPYSNIIWKERHMCNYVKFIPVNIYIYFLFFQVIKKCADEGTRPKVADFGDRVEDSNFLNQLQNGVARWIREIQKVS